jgi:hypothetical protein
MLKNTSGAHSEESSKGETAMAKAVPTRDPMTAVRRYIDAFKKGDAKAMAARFAAPDQSTTD